MTFITGGQPRKNSASKVGTRAAGILRGITQVST
jgi:hypothetical protein